MPVYIYRLLTTNSIDEKIYQVRLMPFPSYRRRQLTRSASNQ